MKKHPESQNAMKNWMKIAGAAAWNNPTDVGKTFRRTDCVNERWLFNIGGNKYRLAAKIWFQNQTIRILKVMTHQEYDQEEWKRDQ
ncbi:MAG: type II toxin-antitoxin system HigB family toxin [Cyanobacteria bacterium SZAS TMP-1]|nr:type II toxin-antitoxin system HigB family toxin [Cyanobacteria bacterium SZAS TMP-1]